MTVAAPTFSQIKAQVAAIRKKLPEARVIGIRSTGRWTGARVNQDGNESYVIEQCDSPLALRIALREPGGSSTTKVLITNIDDKDLSADILVRLAKRQLFPIDSWQIVKSLFQAHAVDPRLTRQRWIADYLMQFVPAGGYPAVAGGFLDAETVWPILLEQVLSLRSNRPDLGSILRWSIDASAVERFRGESPEFREAVIAWLTETAGPAVTGVFRSIEANDRPDALPIGLAVGIVFNSTIKSQLDRAAGKMEERFLGRVSPDKASVDRWSASAAEVVRLQVADPRVKGGLLQRADEILKEIGADAFAYLSSTSPLGFGQRLERFAKELARLLDGSVIGALGELKAARDEIREHDLAPREQRRLERVEMAARLLRWLSLVEDRPSAIPRSLAEAAEYHLAEGGFVDWARLTLRTGDPVRQVSEAYAKLFTRVTKVREAQAQAFGELLRSATESNSVASGIVPVERFLDEVVAPLASKHRILLIVVDGMSTAVCRELLPDLLGHEWTAINRAERHSLLSAGLATIPSVTEVSRASLLSGRLKQGGSDAEQTAFAEHPALRSHCTNGYPPRLFHKSGLHDEADAILRADVRKEIEATDRKIVGVVINAVDDHLLKGDQLDSHWSRDSIPVLSALLHEAKQAKRLVVITSDHGHVLDSNSACKPAEGGERWRIAISAPLEGELQLKGPRVVIPESKTLIAPWSEKIRYGIKKNGYHGGITPQEMVTPIAVLSPSDALPEGWDPVAVDLPSWWEESSETGPGTRSDLSTEKPSRPRQAKLLFDTEDDTLKAAAPVPAPANDVPPIWVTELFRSPIFAQQKRLAGRALPSDDILRSVLSILDHRGGKMTSAALSRSVNYPPTRLRGLVAIMQRLLNIDGFAVLTRDDASDTVSLNRELLRRQFDLR